MNFFFFRSETPLFIKLFGSFGKLKKIIYVIVVFKETTPFY